MPAKKEKLLIEGNEACGLAAIDAGCRFFAGYPITPSTEIAEYLSRELPKVDGTFIQMEDEISSMAAIIGASRTGALAMTATSGPGFSLMQENLGLAVMTETPCVLVNVMRAGPSTGLPTIAMQGDVMQARWGRHGDSMVPVLCPNSVGEMYDLTIRAFEIAERYESPVILLSDGFVGHMWENIERKPRRVDKATLAKCFGRGKKLSFTGLIHDERGFPSSDMENYGRFLKRQHEKFDGLKDVQIVNPDAKKFIVSFGCTARSAEEAATRWGYGLIRPRILFPFPEREIEMALSKAGKVMAVEMNMGQLHQLLRPIGHDVASMQCIELPSPSAIRERMEAL